MKIRHIQNGCDYNSQSHPFFVCHKMFLMCHQNVPQVSLVIKSIRFLFSRGINAPYLSPEYHNKFIYKLLQRELNDNSSVSKSSLSVTNKFQKFPICPQIATKVPYLSLRFSPSVPQNLPICPQNLKTSPSVPKESKMFPKCPHNTPKVSPKTS